MNPIQLAEEKQRIIQQLLKEQQFKEQQYYSQRYSEPPRALTPELLEQFQRMERDRNRSMEEQMVQRALQKAINEVVERLASTIINERRAEIEAACNFSDLRDALAAELARQFMAARFLGQPTLMNAKPLMQGGGVGAQQSQVAMGKQAQQQGLLQKTVQLGLVKP